MYTDYPECPGIQDWVCAGFLQGLTADEAADDDFCERLVEEYEADPEKDVAFPLEECKREWGLG